MKINTKDAPLKITKKFTDILEKEIAAATNNKEFVPAEGEAITVIFRDPDYSADRGGFHPVEVRIDGNGRIEYITDMAFVGPPDMADLEKELDFDFGMEMFQQMGRVYPIYAGRGIFRTFQSNFCAYYKMGVYEVEVSSG